VEREPFLNLVLVLLPVLRLLALAEYKGSVLLLLSSVKPRSNPF
jgi:hypothetical protein